MAYRLDHLVIVAADLERALAEHGARFGRAPEWRASSDGTETAEWRTRTGAVEVLVPSSGASLDPASTGPKSLVLGVDDIQRARANLLAAGLQPGPIARAEASDARTGERRAWQRLRCADAVLGGLKLFVVQRDGAVPVPNEPELVEIELRTGAPGALAGLLGGALGLAQTRDNAFALSGVTLTVREDPGASAHRIARYLLSGESSTYGAR